MNCLMVLILGIVFLATAFVGTFAPEFMGMALSPTQVMFVFFSGIVALAAGLRRSQAESGMTASVLGVMYIFLGLGTLISGPGYANPEGLFINSNHVFRVIQGHFELTTADGIRNLLFGVFALSVGFGHWNSESGFHYSDAGV